MAVTTRSIPAVPYGGGTLKLNFTSMANTNACILNSTRMVWTYCQSTPNWRYFHIVDTPGGWATPGGTPTTTTAQMLDQVQYQGVFSHMCRLNDNAFLVLDWSSAGNSSNSNYFYYYWVIEIDANNNMTVTTSGTFNPGNGTSTPTGYATGVGRSVAPSNLVNLSDNVVFMHGAAPDNLYYWVQYLITYNTTTKTLSWTNRSSYDVGLYSSTGYTGYFEAYSKTIPGSSKVAVYLASRSNATSFNTGYVASALINADGSKGFTETGNASQEVSPGAYHINMLDGAYMSETRQVKASNFNNYNYYGIDGTTSQGSGQVSNTSSTNPMILGAMDANYFAALDRTHWSGVTPTATVIPATANLNVKIMRREDSNFTTQSAASAASATGFTIANVPYIEPFWNHRPKMLSTGDWFWWGLDKNFNLAWNVLKNPT